MAENGPFDVDNAVRQVLCGDMEFYSAIVRQFQGDVWRLLAPLLYDREATRDMVQETFVKAFFGLRGYRLGSSFRAWLLTIARNTALNEIRSRSRKARHLDSYREDYAARIDVDNMDTGSDDVRLAALQECRDALPRHLRIVVTLRYAERLEVQKIAARVGRSVEAVRQMLWRIRGVLRDCIEKKMAQA
jgi:RNA polymerase sigma-70 factor (ECF subfamily)